MGVANETITRDGLVQYLQDAFEQVDYDRARELVDKHSDIVQDGFNMLSHNYYVGNQIAEAESLVDREDYDPDAEEDEDEE